MSAINHFLISLTSYLDSQQIELVKRAYYYAETAHGEQRRTSGEPYITHPLAVAKILASMHMDHHSLAAAMLHDVIEDTGVGKAELEEQFGVTVAQLVDGVSKLTNIEFSSREEKQAHNFEKMAIAMSKDIRVIIVKLADRLHNMRTLGPLKSEKRRRIAKETLEIYARIAARLGMQRLHIEFEDRGFEALYPLRARRLKAAVSSVRSKQKELVEHIKESLDNQVQRWNINALIIGREKHLFSIYRKMELTGEKKKRFRDITDVFAFRVIAESIDDCYRVLGAVHSLYSPMPGRIKDYIAIPKINGYQSIHTVLNGPQNIPIEVQIRTKEMDEIANAGIAAHWLYKSDDDGSVSHSRARRWVKNLLELQQSAGDPLEFIEQVKNDFFSDEIYVFTPKGKIIELPRDATAVDFAYAVHTEIGNTCFACRINNRSASLNQTLENGQKVQIITAEDRRPQALWLSSVKTSKARIAIRHALKNYQQQDAIDLGRRMLNRTLAQIGVCVDENVAPDHLRSVFEELSYKNIDELLSAIGLGKQMSTTVAKLLVPERADEISTHVESPLTIDSTDGTMITLSRCCHPIPGDPILGVMSSDKGLAIHVDTCKNIADIRDNIEKVNHVNWSPNVQGEFPVDLIINVESDRSLFAKIASRITEMGANIEKIQYKEQDPNRNILRLTIAVRNRVHLADILRRIRGMRQVEKIGRDKN
ncbi:bifunctional GTP diphosphokinase/guanosine-3',5'-bis(diphosphate) 3'-diphosphatase [Candidatus Endobugula sertula]|uniref:guanosine-3',5'-bis(diphosphate) 3'-diphosphatase n=1 Tax=Candidatus Endobugula sertula TaxID=62101 RepID=A0A1D2QTC6_9GAMM|nr:bifunctional GTP diphosphokinase/guanosine-3',5'-bis(diphosphate) 3'-diphosphatase [Candidatus Endobugula sertula]